MDDLIAFVRARLDEREEIAKSALVRNAGEWSLFSDLESRGWWNEGHDPVLLVGGKPLATFNEEYGGFLVAYHVLANDPKFVLDDIAAKRQIIATIWAAFAVQPGRDMASMVVYAERAVLRDVAKALAFPFASHLDYREEWRP
jgi:hypothetical protein